MHQIVVQLCKRCRLSKEVRRVVSTHDVEAFLGGRRAAELRRHGQAASSGSKTKAPGSAGGYLLYACGLRIGEAAKVEVGDIDNTKGVLRIIGKGNKERRVPLPEPMLVKLRRVWLTHRNPRWLTPDRSVAGQVST